MNKLSHIADRIATNIVCAMETSQKVAADILEKLPKVIADPQQVLWVGYGVVESIVGDDFKIRVTSVNGSTDGDDLGFYSPVKGVTSLLRGKTIRAEVLVGFVGPRDDYPKNIGEELEGYPASKIGSVYAVRIPHAVRVKILGARQDSDGTVYLTTRIEG